MSELNYNQIREIYLKLPKDLKDAFFSVDIAEKLQAIGKARGLDIEQTGELSGEVGLVILGVTNPSDFVGHLAERLDVSKEEAEKVAADVNAQILAPIRESLQSLHESGAAAASVLEKGKGSAGADVFSLFKTEKPNGVPASAGMNGIIPAPKPSADTAPVSINVEKAAVREEMMKEIEKVELPPNPFEAKLNGLQGGGGGEIFRLPPEEKVMEEKSEPVKDIKRYASVDPYREQV